MVRGLEIFKKYFKDYTVNYVIIGGTACDILIEEAGLIPRVTQDFDMILIMEAFNDDFVKQFWKFIRDGKYTRKEEAGEKRNYYRFMKPEDMSFPAQVELFSRVPDMIKADKDMHLTPIPVGEDLSSLSAILMNEDYYHYMIDHSEEKDGVRFAKTEALICLKAKAYLEINERIKNGSTEDSRHLKKHKSDVFRLAVLLNENELFELPESIKYDMQQFFDSVKDELPDKDIYRRMRAGDLDSEKVYHQLVRSFLI